MKIGPEDNRVSARRKWGVPLGVATGVAAVSVSAVAAFGGVGDAKPLRADVSPGGNPSTSAGAHPSPSAGRTQTTPATFTLTSSKTTPIAAGSTARILKSCLGSDASRFHSVLAVRAPVASEDQDGVVVAVDSAGQYVQCVAKGDKGRSDNSPPTFINNRLWGTGHTVEYFDSTSSRAGKGKSLMVGAGHYTSNIARITISYGDNPKEYPADMAGGAFVYAAAVSVQGSADDPRSAGGPNPYVHAYDASGKEIYNQRKDSQLGNK